MASDVFILRKQGIREFFMPIGSVDRFLHHKAVQIQGHARRTAPMRGGHLKASHDVERPRGAGGQFLPGSKYGTTYRVINTAAYAYVVHEGTAILGHPPGGKTITRGGVSKTSPNRRAMLGPLPPWGSHAIPFHVAVSGQHSNPWLSDAMAKVMLGL